MYIVSEDAKWGNNDEDINSPLNEIFTAADPTNLKKFNSIWMSGGNEYTC